MPRLLAVSRYLDAHRGFAPLPGADARQDLEGHARIRINALRQMYRQGLGPSAQ